MPPTDASTDTGTSPHPGGPEDTLDLRLPEELLSLLRDTDPATAHRTAPSVPPEDDLLDNPLAWGPATTAAGVFRLAPVSIDRDLSLISRWMNDPAVAAFWELPGPESVTAAHLRSQLDGDGRSSPAWAYWTAHR